MDHSFSVSLNRHCTFPEKQFIRSHQSSLDPVVESKVDLTCLTLQCINAELSGLNVHLDPNGCHRVARSLTGYITDQSSAPGVPAESQVAQQGHNNTRPYTHTCTHT